MVPVKTGPGVDDSASGTTHDPGQPSAMQDTSDNPRSSTASDAAVGAEPSESDEPGGPRAQRRHASASELPILLEIEDVARALDAGSRRWLEDVALRAVDAALSLPENATDLGVRDPFQHTTMTPHPHPAPGAAAERVDGRAHRVRIAVVDDGRMAAMHERHSGVSGTTDVLTFDMREDGDGPLDVDIVVCIDEARRQADRRGHVVERELLLYILHGALHCLGHDDRDPDASAAMHVREDEILAAIGVGAVYAAAGDDAATPQVRAIGAASADRARELNV